MSDMGHNPAHGPVLVTGGTGTLGSHVVRALHQRGCQVRVLSRKERAGGEGTESVTGDLVTAAGVQKAVAGAGVIVHCASAKNGDVAATRHLVNAALAQDRPPHLVYISVVGTDRVPFGYFKTKVAAAASRTRPTRSAPSLRAARPSNVPPGTQGSAALTRTDTVDVRALPEASLWHMCDSYKAETEWAPPHVGRQLRGVRLAAEDARQLAIRSKAEATAATDAETAERHTRMAASAEALQPAYRRIETRLGRGDRRPAGLGADHRRAATPGRRRRLRTPPP
jgi:hypothetical protein